MADPHRMLTARLLLLTRRLADLGAEPARLVQGDEADRAVANEAYELELHAKERMVEEARAIAAALQRIEAGEYGTCADCGGRIAPKRLAVLPTTTRCRACQEERERVRAHLGRRVPLPEEESWSES